MHLDRMPAGAPVDGDMSQPHLHLSVFAASRGAALPLTLCRAELLSCGAWGSAPELGRPPAPKL